jgi:hypothetical protein
MKWNKVKDKPLPKGRMFICLWKDAFSKEYPFLLAEHCSFEDKDYFSCFYTNGPMRIDPISDVKITHWLDIKHPQDY